MAGPAVDAADRAAQALAPETSQPCHSAHPEHPALSENGVAGAGELGLAPVSHHQAIAVVDGTGMRLGRSLPAPVPDVAAGRSFAAARHDAATDVATRRMKHPHAIAQAGSRRWDRQGGDGEESQEGRPLHESDNSAGRAPTRVAAPTGAPAGAAMSVRGRQAAAGPLRQRRPSLTCRSTTTCSCSSSGSCPCPDDSSYRSAAWRQTAGCRGLCAAGEP